MLDFMKISTRPTKKGGVEIFPKFIVGKHDDLMIRGGDFYAIWIEERNLWSTDENDAIELIDKYLDDYAAMYKEKYDEKPIVAHMWDSSTGLIDQWHKYCQRQLRDKYKPLDENLVFANDNVKKDSYATKKLNYALAPGESPAYDELMEILYAPEERHKIEWGIGAIVTGASKTIQKFLVFYGAPGTGKSTVLNIIQQLFEGYYSTFDSRALGSASDSFALEAFKNNPLIAIQHDGDLSHIEDNTRLNSVVSHELMTINEKHKALYMSRFISFLILGTNKPVKITDSKSGCLRRLIDVYPTGKKLPYQTYNKLIKKIEFELGAIAYHCKEVYEADPEFYNNYLPVKMMGASNPFFNFIEESYDIFKRDDRTTLKEAWEMYKNYVNDAHVQYPLSKAAVKNELKSYFDNYYEDKQDPDTGLHIRNLYAGFRYKIFDDDGKHADEHKIVEVDIKSLAKIEFKKQHSALDDLCADCPAQYATSQETPSKKWSDVTTTLKNITTSKLHYVKPIDNLIVIDFDLKDSNGNKSFEKNLEAASKWPKTYAELSKSGAGIHLHYIYDGDVNQLSRIYDDEIEIKVFTGNSSLRRKVTKCSSDTIAHISTGLPLKGNVKKVESLDIIKNEKALRVMIKKCLNKENHGATKPEVDFIKYLLDQAYNSGMKYDVSDLHNTILIFAAGSTHQAEKCLELVQQMQFRSEDISQSIDGVENADAPIVFYDVEVFPNLFLVNWKILGQEKVVRWINPTSTQIEDLINHNNYKLVGFNCRRYDNHMLYARLLGATCEDLYKLSQKIVNGDRSAFFGEAYNISYTDIYDYCSASNKQSLKKWEIQLGITHLELGLPWDKPVPEELWEKVAEYCDNDVISTEAVWNATQDDFLARQILADITGMSVNDTTNSLTTRLIFGKEKHPNLVYTDLSETFPGYKFEKTWNPDTNTYTKKNMYMDTDLGFGGYVFAVPGMYTNVALLDVASLHPHSAIELNAFGDYTKNYKDLVDARVYIKHKDYAKAKTMFNGKLSKYLTDDKQAKKLSTALKTAINSVYGLTSAKFENPFRDPKNENNIIALRGALFMRTLQKEVLDRGFQVAHIKTDSIKIPNATKEIIDFCMDFASKYGYEFEHEATYERMCLVNDSTYIARFMTKERATELYGYAPDECASDGGKWTATGLQFQVPYVFKFCFSHEKIVFDDMCEAKEVKTAIYLDYNEGKIDTTKLEQELYVITNGNREPERQEELKKIIADNHNYQFIGRVGLFCPIKEGCGGALLLRESTKKDGSIGYDAVVGSKGYRWKEAANVKDICEQDINTDYYKKLVDEAIETINQYGDYEWFVSEDTAM